ncbi:MAG: glycosyltransferase [Chloroflexi bacterium]|nr:glycosyltransferase [Chloroflexota bacterium]
MADQGHAVSVVAPYDPAIQPDYSSSVNVHRFRYTWPKKWHIMGHARSLESDTRLKLGTYFLLPFFFLGAFIKLMQVTYQEKSELIHTHWVLPNGPAAVITAKLRGIPLVISLHGSDIYIARKKRIFGLVARWVFHHSSAITACSPALRSAAIELGAQQSVQLITWGADPNIFHPKATSTKSTGTKITVASLGRMVPKKGFDQLILAWKDIIIEYPQSRLIVGGEGSQKATLETLSARLGLADSVTFPGRIPWDEVPDFLAMADIFVVPSIKDNEGNMDGLPTVIPEAMGCGLPIIASRLGGIPSIIKDKYNGILIPPGDVIALHNGIKYLLDHPTERKTLGAAAYSSIQNKYNWENITKEFLILFSQSLSLLK